MACGSSRVVCLIWQCFGLENWCVAACEAEAVGRSDRRKLIYALPRLQHRTRRAGWRRDASCYGACNAFVHRWEEESLSSRDAVTDRGKRGEWVIGVCFANWCALVYCFAWFPCRLMLWLGKHFRNLELHEYSFCACISSCVCYQKRSDILACL